MADAQSAMGVAALASLKDLAAARTPQARDALFTRLCDLAFGQGSPLSAAERDAVSEIMPGLLRFADPQARAGLSALLARTDQAPEALLRALAFDNYEIARPILECSTTISDDALVDLLREGSSAHRTAIANRAGLSTTVSKAIVALDDAQLTECLAANATARIDTDTFVRMVAESEHSPRLTKLLMSRADMPSILAHRMFWWAPAQVRRQMAERHMIELKELEAALKDGQASGLLRPPKSGKFRPFNEFISAQDYMPVSGLIDILRQGSLEHFSLALAERLALDARTAHRIVADAGGEAVAIACRALRAEKGQFMSMFFILDYMRFGKARPPSDLSHVSTMYDKVSHSRASASVIMWDRLETAAQ